MNVRLSAGRSPFWIIFPLLACLVISFSFAYRFAKEERSLYRRARLSLGAMQQLESGVVDERKDLMQRHGKNASPLQDVVGEDLLAKVQMEPNEPVALPEGFQIETVRLRFQHLRWDQVRDLMTRLETGTPPWRIEGLQIEAGLTDLSGWLDLAVLERPTEP